MNDSKERKLSNRCKESELQRGSTSSKGKGLIEISGQSTPVMRTWPAQRSEMSTAYHTLCALTPLLILCLSVDIFWASF